MSRALAAPGAVERAGDGDGDPDVVVASVTYNSADTIEAFLGALAAALDGIDRARVVIVDNDSRDGTPALIRELAPWVVLVEAGGNLGYAAGINLALRQGLGRRGVYVLNPDAVPSPGSVATLLSALESDPRVGIVTPTVLDVEGRLKFSLRREPTLLRAVGEAVLGGHRAARFPALGDMIRDPGYYRDGATADWATGAALLLSRDVLDVVGAWDEQFFLYSEETDYALRARDAGFELRFVPGAAVVHPGGEMSRSPALWSLVATNRTRLYRKRHGRLASAAYWTVVLLNEASRAALGRKTHRAATRALLRLGPNPGVEARIPDLGVTSLES